MLLHVALAGYMALNGVDLAQTAACLGAERCREANRIMRVFADRPGALGAMKLGLDSAAVIGILHLRRDHPRLAWGLTILGIAAEGAATLHNARQVR